MTERSPVRDLVLVGGGHAHIQVLKRFVMAPPRGVRVTLIVDTPVAVYSGMVPGYVAGLYERRDLEIDVLPLARLAGARVVIAAATGIDPDDRRVEVEGRPSIAYDVLSLDVGSTVAGLSTPGVAEYALATRPIGRFAAKVEEPIEKAMALRPEHFQIVVVGGGAGGVELAFALDHRIRTIEGGSVTLVESGTEILAGYGAQVRKQVRRAARERGITIVEGRTVGTVLSDSVTIGGEPLPADLVVWVAGAAPHPFLMNGPLAVGSDGFLPIGATLEVEGVEDIFAAGDCATLVDAPWVPKAGVYAVRQGPILAENLSRRCEGRTTLRRYRPQRDFLTLLAEGDGSAVGTKWGVSLRGPSVFRLKDYIDRRFMQKFQVLGIEDRVNDDFLSRVEMREGMGMLCGGCAAKLGKGALDRTLDRLDFGPPDRSVELGVAQGDDAVAFRVSGGDRIVSSVDQFRPFTDDPYLVGRIGAVNAASDVIAKGVAPKFAQALVSLPDDESEGRREELLYQILSGARDAFVAMGVTLLGGHTTTAQGLLVGFQVDGIAEAETDLLSIDRLTSGCELVLSKPLGTGVLLHADMVGRVRGEWYEQAIVSMARTNIDVARIARDAGATAATDVTGFGLAQHLGAMLVASGVSGTLQLDSLPALPGVMTLLGAGDRSTFHDENARAAKGIDWSDGARGHPRAPLLFDPQTSGGLIFGVPVGRGNDVVASLREAGHSGAAVVGTTRPDDGVPLAVEG